VYVYRSVLWMKYGMMKADSAMTIVNAVGTVLGLIYSVIYYWYTAHTVRPSITSSADQPSFRKKSIH